MIEPAPSGQNSDFVAKFLQNVRGTVPLAIEQVDMMLQLITAARGENIGTFLDLGCGDAVLSSAILDEHPRSRGLLVDFSEPMLDAARRRLQSAAQRAEFLQADIRSPGWARRVAPHAPLDVVVSAFALHDLPDTRKRALYGEIFELLAPEGIFINIQHVSSTTRWTESVWDDYMIDAIFGPEVKALPGKSRAEVAREYYNTRSGNDANVLAPLEVQCDWLRDIGFENVDCFLKIQELAVFGGQKPA